jgi:hypothetical protein
MRQILEMTSKYRIRPFHLFVDFKATCDTKRGNTLLETLKEFKMPLKLINLVKVSLEHMTGRVKIRDYLPEQSENSVGLRQGNASPCLLFNLALEKIIRDSEIENK